MATIQVTSGGVPFTVRLVRRGDGYGQDFRLRHDKDDPLVEFYDARHPHTEFGQFVSHYYATTLAQHQEGFGIDLDGGVSDWSLGAGVVQDVLRWLRAQLGAAVENGPRQAFLQAIIEAPDDDAPRLIFADWLDDQGDQLSQDQAALIRVQCSLSQPGLSPEERLPLESRQRSLLRTAARRKQLAGAFATHLSGFAFRRGLVESAAMTAGAFALFADLLFSEAPIRVLHLDFEGADAFRPRACLARLTHLSISLGRLTGPNVDLLARCDLLAGLKQLTVRVFSSDPVATRLLRRRFGGRFKLTRQHG